VVHPTPLDHRPAGEERRHPGQQLGAPVEHPDPGGPDILWPENAEKSAPRSATSTGMCGTDWQASTSTSAPTGARPGGQLGPD
jgi:hypothetical protein